VIRSILGACATAAVFLASSGAAYAQAVQSGDVFQVDSSGTMVVVDTCVTAPYPKCTYVFQLADGTITGQRDGWNEDLVEMRDAFSGSSTSYDSDVAPVNSSCGDTIYTSPTSGNVPWSAQVAQDYIRNVFTSQATQNLSVSVSFNALREGTPIRNDRGYDPATGATLVTFGAPEGAMLYPITANFTVCEETGYSTSEQYDYDWKMYCFVDEYREWVCGTY